MHQWLDTPSIQPTQAGITLPRGFTHSPPAAAAQSRLRMESVTAAMRAPGPHLCCIVEHFHAVHLHHHKNNRLAIRLTAAPACCCCCRFRLWRQGRQRAPHAVAAERFAHACCYAGAAVGCVAGRHGQFEACVVLLLPQILCAAKSQTRGDTVRSKGLGGYSTAQGSGCLHVSKGCTPAAMPHTQRR